jgi:hypothetical protein
MKTLKTVAGWRWIVVTLVAGGMLLAPSLLAYGQTNGFSITIPLDTVVYIPYDSNRVLASEPVPPEFAGQSCAVSGISRNQDSVHPDNDLIVSSGGSQVILENVEDEPGETLHAAGSLTLDSDVTVTLHMGPDAVFSAGIDVIIDCSQVNPTTTTMATTTTTLATTTTTGPGPTTTEPVTTTVPPPPEETTSTVPDEVRGTVITSTTVGGLEELPFTGPVDEGWVFLASGLVVIGLILVVASRRHES